MRLGPLVLKVSQGRQALQVQTQPSQVQQGQPVPLVLKVIKELRVQLERQVLLAQQDQPALRAI